MTQFLILDVFTEAPFGGNQLGVVPDATGLPEDRLQKIAREFNFSETTFVFPPEDPAHTARVRIFTPMSEVPFAGHPTVGTAVALAGLGHGPEMVLELGVGPIPVTVTGNRARFTTGVPLHRSGAPDPALVARCMGLEPSAIRRDRHGPEIAGVGLDFCLAELTSTEALAAAVPDTARFREAHAIHQVKPDFAILAYVRDGDHIRARMFAPLDGITEDPATGSAAAALAGYLATLEERALALTIDQGVEMGRPSRIEVSADWESGGLKSVTVAGSAVKVAEGRLTLD